MDENELTVRVCRCCGQEYDYPVRKSLATRRHCDVCVTLDENARRAFEGLNRRLTTLTHELSELKAAQGDPEGPK